MSSSLPPSSLPPGRTDLITERLVLRMWTDGEIAAVLGGERRAHWADDFPAEGDRVIAGHLAEHPGRSGAYGHRQVVERESGLVVGAVGLFWPPSEGTVEFGYGIVASRRGLGYATEAARAIAAHALTAPGVHTVYANVELSNPASARVLEKAGLRYWGGDATMACYRLTRTAPRGS